MNIRTAVFGGGCFWCTEAIFQRLRGVQSVTPGYSGGEIANPTYEQVSSGNTGHAEVIKVEYDSDVISYSDLLNVFFSSHDPTTLNRQGNDMGTQYRSIIFYTDNEQKLEAERYIRELVKDKIFENAIVTEAVPLKTVYPAEDYHQNFYNNNKSYSYCQVVINPKILKLRESFKHLLKQE